jgi:hypothetical protein
MRMGTLNFLCSWEYNERAMALRELLESIGKFMFHMLLLVY